MAPRPSFSVPLYIALISTDEGRVMGLFEGELHFLQDQEVDDQKLYHYTSPSTLDAILENRTIRLGPYSQTNDPRETKEWVPLFMMPDGPGRPAERYLTNSLESSKEAALATDHYLRRGARVACFTLDRQRASNATAGTLFHRGWGRASLWQQYAGRHGGACLVFDRSQLIELVDEHRPFNDGDLFSFGRVHYVDQAMTIHLPWMDVVDDDITSVLDNFQVRQGAADHLYFTKNTDWSSEEEFRIVYVQWDVCDEDVDLPIDIPYESSLFAIVFGEAFPDTELNDIRNRKGIPDNVDLLQCKWSSGVPILVYAEPQRGAHRGGGQS
jgi:Protein of unknown function (DUF2971)